jgi:protocatechuate 3,4-dioxygenase beta subunit
MPPIILGPLIAGVLLVGSQAQPRDTGPPQAGTATIRGRVVSADTGAAVRGALVTLLSQANEGFPPRDGRAISAMLRTSRNFAADAAGQFEFVGLAAGTYRIVVAPGANQSRYLAAGYMATRANDAGRAIVLGDGENLKDVEIRLATASAIEGRVVDETGEPASRVYINAYRLSPGNAFAQQTASGPAQTDDHGRFRIYGLGPGTYIVAAEGVRTNRSRIEGDSQDFATTFHPSSTTDLQARKVSVLASQDVHGIDIQLVRASRFDVSGVVVDSQGRPLPSASVALVRPSLVSPGSRAGVDGAGRFAFRDVDAGDYSLVVTAPEVHEYAHMPVNVSSDVDNMVVATRPAVTLQGRVVLADGAPLTKASLRVIVQGVQFASGSRTMESTIDVDDDLRFTLTGLFGAKLLRFASLPDGWALKTVTLGGRDITDLPTEFRPEDDGDLQMVVTTRAATLEGVVVDEKAAAASEALVYIFGQDTASWKRASGPLFAAETHSGGRFSLRGLPSGRYYAIAVARDGFRAPTNATEEFFEILAAGATPIVLGEDEHRVISLPLWRWPE